MQFHPFPSRAPPLLPQSHVVPFSQPPGPPPGSLGFGFGLSSANNHGITISSSIPTTTTTTTTPNSRRRRREDSPINEDALPSSPPRDKKPRVLNNTTTSNQEQPEQDLGKALALLPHSSLLSLLHRLITLQPSLSPLIHSLLPAPSLESTLTTLTTRERNVLSAIPLLTHGQGRAEYIWMRARGPLEDWAREATTALGEFGLNPTTNRTRRRDAGESHAEEIDNEHPSTGFTLLYSLTASFRRLESALPPSPSPSPSTSTSTSGSALDALAPLLIQAWHHWLTLLAQRVNLQGRVLGQESVRGWFERVDELCSATVGVPTTTPHPPAFSNSNYNSHTHSAFGAGAGLGSSSSSSGFGFGFGTSSFGSTSTLLRPPFPSPFPPLTPTPTPIPTATPATRDSVLRKECQGVRERMRTEVGWLVGVGGSGGGGGGGGGVMSSSGSFFGAGAGGGGGRGNPNGNEPPRSLSRQGSGSEMEC